MPPGFCRKNASSDPSRTNARHHPLHTPSVYLSRVCSSRCIRPPIHPSSRASIPFRSSGRGGKNNASTELGSGHCGVRWVVGRRRARWLAPRGVATQPYPQRSLSFPPSLPLSLPLLRCLAPSSFAPFHRRSVSLSSLSLSLSPFPFRSEFTRSDNNRNSPSPSLPSVTRYRAPTSSRWSLFPLVDFARRLAGGGRDDAYGTDRALYQAGASPTYYNGQALLSVSLSSAVRHTLPMRPCAQTIVSPGMGGPLCAIATPSASPACARRFFFFSPSLFLSFCATTRSRFSARWNRGIRGGEWF